MMDFKERVLIALNHEEPDRVPVLGLIDQALSNQILGKQPADVGSMLGNAELRSGIKDIMNSTWPEIMYNAFADYMEAAIKLGFDAANSIYSQMQVIEEPEFKLGLALHDVWGRAWDLRVDENGNTVANYVRGLCTTEKEWDAWVERNKPLYDELIKNGREHHKKLAESYGDRILPIGFTGPGIFENTWQPIGFENFCKYVYQKPDFVKKVIAFQTDVYMKYLDAMMESDVEVVQGGDDLGQKTGPLMRPELIEKLLGDSYRRVSEAVHRQGKKLLWHSCGNIYAFLSKFVEWGFDGLVTLEPTAGMELGKVREQVGHKLVLVGNLDVSYLLVRGTKEEVEDAVKKSIKDVAKGGGYILSPSTAHVSVDPMRLKWMIDAAHKYGKYPINI
jgi:hypothetical protein